MSASKILDGAQEWVAGLLKPTPHAMTPNEAQTMDERLRLAFAAFDNDETPSDEIFYYFKECLAARGLAVVDANPPPSVARVEAIARWLAMRAAYNEDNTGEVAWRFEEFNTPQAYVDMRWEDFANSANNLITADPATALMAQMAEGMNKANELIATIDAGKVLGLPQIQSVARSAMRTLDAPLHAYRQLNGEV